MAVLPLEAAAAEPLLEASTLKRATTTTSTIKLMRNQFS